MLLDMNADIPTSSELREKLAALSWAQVQELCRKTGAPFTTVWKIRSGETTDPRLETVRLIWPELLPPAVQPASTERRKPADLPVTVAISGHEVAAPPAAVASNTQETRDAA